MNTTRYATLAQRLEDAEKEITQLKLKFRGQVVTEKKLRPTDDVQAFIDDYEAIKRLQRYGL